MKRKPPTQRRKPEDTSRRALALLEASREVGRPTATRFVEVKRTRVRGSSVSLTLLRDRG